MYFNTTSEQGQLLMEFTNKAGAQDIIILDLFQEVRKPLTAWEALQLLEAKGQKILITSVRRSINTLCKNSILVNTGNKISDIQGRPTFKFKLNL